MGDMTRNFSRHEFACKGKRCCGNSAPVLPELVLGLQELRDRAGIPLVISSGFRCRTHNKRVSGTPDSQHCLGTAADVTCPRGWTPERLAQLAESVPAFRDGGIGVYPEQGFVHVDVRGTPARWGRLGGKYVSYEAAMNHNGGENRGTT
jgi:zinc D-Ala-D-Ala carboxypeptidase